MSEEKIGQRQLDIMARGGATRGPIVMDKRILKEVEEKLTKNPKDFIAWVSRGILYFNDDFEQAIISFSNALSLQPFNGDQYYNRGRKFLSEDRFPQALADLTMSTHLDETDAWKWHFRGVAHYFLNQFDEAIECFKRSISLHIKNGTNNTPPERDWIFMSLLHQNKVQEALDSIKDVSPDLPVEKGDLMYLKRCLLYTGQTSLEDFDKNVDRTFAKRIITELYGAVVYCHWIKKGSNQNFVG